MNFTVLPAIPLVGWLILLTLAAGAGTLVTWLFGSIRRGALEERLRLREEEGQRQAAQAADLRTRLDSAESERNRVQQELAAVRADAEARIAAERRRTEEQEARTAQYVADVEKMRAALQAEFQVVASRLLEEKTARFTAQNKTQVDEVLQPLRQQLVDFRTRIDAVYKSESDDRTSLKAQVEQLRQLNSRITDEARALTQALKGQSQVRGAWGELVLEKILEGSGLRRGEDYSLQESIASADGGRRVRPDVILRLPDQRHLVIDSKVSLVDYEQHVNAPEAEPREAARRAHASSVRRHIEGLSRQHYSEAGGLGSPDFVFMFIPLEPAFIAAIEADPGLYEWAFNRKVILVTAPTLLATLRTVASLWKQERQTRNVLEIAKRGGLLYDKFAGLYAELEEVGRHLERAQESHGDVLARLKTGRGSLLSQVEELKLLGAKAQKALPQAEPERAELAAEPLP